MFELLFILLPVAAAYGYYMGRHSAGTKRQDDRHTKHTNYLHGVEYLLNNEKDRAVDKFIAYLNESDPSFENNMALGNLFRKRGEFDKAIMLHETLAANDNLEENETELSRLELARDFVAAGLLDRAERILIEIVDIPRLRDDVVELLVRLYEQERDFPRAIEMALTYREHLGKNSLLRLSHYYCEIAESEFINGDAKKSLSMFMQAMDIYDRSVRAMIGLCRLELKDKKLDEAYARLKSTIEIDSSYGIVYLDLLGQCFPDRADPKLRFALEDLIRRCKSAAAMVTLVELVDVSAHDDAERMLLNFIQENPNLKLFSALMRMRSKYNNDSSSDAILQLKSLVDAQIARNYVYVCHSCGFESKILFWQCPSCRRWESMKAIRGLDGD